MSYRTRQTTVGNTNVDFTKVRKGFSNLPPYIQSTLRNAVPHNGVTPDKGDIAGTDTVNQYKLQRLSDAISNNINAVSDLRAITPYVDKAELIWNTILLYPNGKQDKILTYDTSPTQYKSVALHTELLKIWQEYYTNDYKIEEDLSKIINDILWNTGSYALFNLSRPGLDYLINGSEVDPRKAREGTEYYDMRNKSLTALRKEFVEIDGSVKVRNLGKFIRDPNGKANTSNVGGLEAILNNNIGAESTEYRLFDKDFDPDNLFNITITDNPACLYLQKFKEQRRVTSADSVMGVENLGMMVDEVLANKAKDPIDDRDTKKKQKHAEKSDATTQTLTEQQVAEAAREIYRSRNVSTQAMQFIKSIDTLSVAPYGRGLTWHIPSEALIPIHYNGQNKRQGDFIALLDPEEGTFLKNTIDPEYYQAINKTKGNISNKNKTGSENTLISSLRTIQQGKECEFDMSEFVDLAKASIIKQFTSAVLSDTAENISVTIDEETNKIFLSRLWRRQGVRCLYIPGEAVTYMALKYSRLGTGQSLTQLAKMHIARLAAYDVADTLANLEGAQPHTLMTITHGKEDGDPENTVAVARQGFYDNNPGLHSLIGGSQLSVPHIVDAMRHSALTVKVNAGDNPLVAVPEIDMSHLEKNYFKPVDDASRNKVMNDIANYFFTPRSWLDVSDESNNFKIEAITEHQMVTNQAVNWQASLSGFIVDFQKKHARVNGPLMTRLIKAIADNKKLWKPEDKSLSLEGDDSTVIKLLLADFFSAVTVSFPEPSNTETTDKLKGQIDAVEALVGKWMDIASSSDVLKGIAESLGLQDPKASGDDVLRHVKAYFYMEAFKRYNIPMPFDEIVNDGKAGGIASLVHGIVHQQVNAQEFYVQYLTAKQKADKAFLKTNKASLEKLLGEVEEAQDGLDTGEPGAEGDEPLPGGDDLEPGEDGQVPGVEPEPGAEEEETEEPVDAPPGEDEDTPPVEEDAADGKGGSNDPTSPDYNPFKPGKK